MWKLIIGVNMNIKQLLGSRIKELRCKQKFTQEKLAEKVNIATKHQSCIETGKNFPSADLIERYAKIFNISPTELLTIKTKEPKEVMVERIYQKLKQASYEDVHKIYKLLSD